MENNKNTEVVETAEVTEADKKGKGKGSAMGGAPALSTWKNPDYGPKGGKKSTRGGKKK